MDVLRIEASPLLHGVADLPAPRADTAAHALVDSLRIHAGKEVVRWIVKLSRWANQPHEQLAALAEALQFWAQDLAAEGGKLVLLCPAEHWHITANFQGLPTFSDRAAAMRALSVATGGSTSTSAHETEQINSRQSDVDTHASRMTRDDVPPASSRRKTSKTRNIPAKLTIVHATAAGGTSIFRLAGPIDTDTVQGFQTTIDRCRAEGRYKFILDLAGVTYVNSTGLGALVRLTEELNADGGVVGLINVQPRVSSIFDMLGLTTIFRVFDDEATACETLAGQIGPKLDLQINIAGLSIAFVPFPPFKDAALGRVVGTLTSQAAAGLGKKLEELCSKGWTKLVLDVSHVAEAPGADTLAEWAEFVRDHGAALVLVQARPKVREAFDNAGLGDIAWFFRDLGDAKTYLRKGTATTDEPSSIAAMGGRLGGFMPPPPGATRRRTVAATSGTAALPMQARPSTLGAPQSSESSQQAQQYKQGDESTGTVIASSSRVPKAPALPDGPTPPPQGQQGRELRHARMEELKQAAAPFEPHHDSMASTSETQTGRSPALDPHRAGSTESSSRRRALAEPAAARVANATHARQPTASVQAAPHRQRVTEAAVDALHVEVTWPGMWRRFADHVLEVSVTSESNQPRRFEVVPNLPGCLVVPPIAALSVSAQQPQARATFQLTPLRRGAVPGANVQVLEAVATRSSHGLRKLAQLAPQRGAPIRVRPDWPIAALPLLGVALFVCAALIEAVGPAPETLIGGGVAMLLGAFGTLLLPGLALAAVCIAAGVYWKVKTNPRQAPPQSHVVPASGESRGNG